jgi:predicted ATPase/class 3 adenylate cyclase
MTNSKPSQLAQYKTALSELTNKRHLLTPETYNLLTRALLDKIRLLQTTPTQESAVGEADEIRIVSVMFIDVKDSTQLARQLEERWKELIGRAHTLLARVVEEYDGEIGQYLGDGLLCFFGARRSRGDDAVRAVGCGLAALAKMNAFAEQVRREYSVEFAVRAAIATGKVVVGVVGTQERGEFLAVGQTTNLAARLQSQANPGELLIDADTHRRVRNHFITYAHAPAQLKGFDGLIEYFTVVERHQPNTVTQTHYQIAGIQVPFIGRENELAALNQIWRRVRDEHRCHVVTIHGEIGTGKSRLLNEISQTRDSDAMLIPMRASVEKRTSSYNLVRSWLAGVCNLTEDTPPEQAQGRILHYVRGVWHDQSSTSDDVESTAAVLGYLAGFGFEDNLHVTSLRRGGPEHERMALSWLGRWFAALARERPLLIAVDNLQWADETSLNLLEYIAAALADLPILLVATARLEFRVSHLEYMAGVANHTEMTLTPLREGDVQTLLNVILKTVDNVPSSLTSLVASRAEGNPLFIEEFLRMLFDNGVVEPAGPGRWKVNRFRYTTTISALPAGLLGVLQARLDDLSSSARAVVQGASVLGVNFWASAVARLLESDVSKLLSDLVARGIIVQHVESRIADETEYAFRHTLYREVSYEMLPRATREQYHRRAAGWFASRVPDRPEYLSVLAEHYEKGAHFEQALYVYTSAAEDRLERGLMDEALKLISIGLGVTRSVPREVALPMACRLWLAEGQVYNALHRYTESTTSITAALGLLDELPRSEMHDERITAARILGSSYRSLGRYGDALETLQNAYLLAEASSDHRQLAGVLRAYGMLALCRGYLSEGRAYFQRALVIAEEQTDQRQIAGTLSQLGTIALERGDLAHALNNLDRVLAINQKSANVYFQILDLRLIAQVYRAVYAYEMALEVLDQADALQATINYRDSLLGIERGLCWIAIGRTEEGLALLRAAARENYQDTYDRQQVMLALLQGLSLTGQYQEAVTVGEGFLNEAQKHNPILHGRGLLWLGFAQRALGDDRVMATLQNALELEQDYAGRDVWLCYYALGTAAQGVAAAGDYYQKAAARIRATAATLHAHPELEVSLLNNSFVQTVLASAG